MRSPLTHVADRDLGEEVHPRRSAGRAVLAGVILASQPRGVDRLQMIEVEGLAFEFDADLGTPCAMPSLDRPLGLGSARLGERQVDTEVGADRPKRAADVRGSSIDIVCPWAAVHAQRLLEDSLVVDGSLAHQSKGQADQVPRRRIDDADESRCCCSSSSWEPPACPGCRGSARCTPRVSDCRSCHLHRTRCTPSRPTTRQTIRSGGHAG
jgi:hypothetical protein